MLGRRLSVTNNTDDRILKIPCRNRCFEGPATSGWLGRLEGGFAAKSVRRPGVVTPSQSRMREGKK